MPEMRFTVEWPDGMRTSHYSPSLVVHDFLVTGERYPVADFVSRTREALDIASERVRAAYGFACTSAAASQAEIARAADGHGTGEVVVLAMEPPLPAVPA
ncbi:MSMEG_0570 family nitrogen starvation response protein [Microbacterium sp. LMI1-1-1.1]|uniref:MSMEG_0570 family nitrogen starvation response protein n=1 Tax=Microbacterium sp. LMI1-1-1.1 TaxID=3135223 RepID=UPI003465B0A6